MSGKSNNSLQILVDCFDDIPNIMTKMNESINNSPTRYKATGRNSSFAVDGVMRGNKRVDVSKRENTHRVERMATQAMRVLDNLSKLPNQKKHARSLTETSAIAQSKLKNLVQSGIDLQKFYQQYDVSRSGKVSYKDFCDTLGAVSSGIGREEAHELARQLDSRRVGLIEYNNILDSLERIHREAAYREGAGAAPASLQQMYQAPPRRENQEQQQVPPQPPQQAWQETPQELKHQQQDQYQHQPQQAYGQNQQDTHSASSETKSEPDSRSTHYTTNNNNTNTNNNSSNNTNTAKVSPRTSFEYIPPADHTTTTTNNDNNTNNTTANTTSPSSPRDRASAEVEARMSIPRRYFHNPEVNHVMYGECARVTPFDFDRHHYHNELHHPHREHRRASSAPTRARKSSFQDSGCNVAPTAEKIHFDELAHYSTSLRAMSDSLKFADGALTTTADPDTHESLRSKFEANPYYVARERTAPSNMHSNKSVESAIVDQISGGVANLRHTLRAYDGSNSGTLNSDELKAALKKSGVKLSNEQYSALYDSVASTTTTTNTPAYSRGQVVSIDTLTDRLQTHTEHTQPSPASVFHATYAKEKAVGTAAAHADKVRIMKKVLNSASKLTNPHAVYKHIAPQHNGTLTQPQLQDALLHMGANLSPKEFTLLVNAIPRDSDGKIELSAFERQLKQDVSAHETNNHSENNSLRQTFKGYSNTFRTSDNFSLAHNNHEFEPLCHKKGLIVPVESDKRWNQLKEVFQANPEVIRRAFEVPRPESPERKSLRALSNNNCNYSNSSYNNTSSVVEVDKDFTKSLGLSELKHALAQSGLPLSSDDVEKVERGLRRAAANNNTNSSGNGSNGGEVSLEKFCEVVGIDVHKKQNDKIALADRARNLDGGVFAESLNSLNGNNNFATSFFNSSGDANPVTGDRRRRAPSASRGTSSDPSKFWELADTNYTSNGLTQLFPSPMPTFRSPNIYDTARGALLLDPSSAQRGVVRINPSQRLAEVYNGISEHAAYLQNQGKGQAGQDHRGRSASVQGASVQSRRSHSAPPRTLLGHPSGSVRNSSNLMAGVMSGHSDSRGGSVNGSSNGSSNGGNGGNGNGTSGYTGTDTHRTLHHANSDSHSTTTTNTATSEPRYDNNKTSMAAKIARWAPGHLSNYYESKERLNLGSSSNTGSGSVGGGSKGSGSNGSVGEGVAPQRSRSSLRRQFQQANQSFMHGASAAGAVNETTSVRSGGSVSGNAPFATYSTFE